MEPNKMHLAEVYITLKRQILDPQGVTVKSALESLGYKGIREVRIGKYILITIEGERKEIEERLTQICERLLANPVIEDYRFEIKEGGVAKW